MAQIEIRHLSGSVEMRPLSRATPLSIGSHSSNNICIDEDGVAVLHCRISWGGKSYEVMCGGADGVDVNGQLVQHATLKDGDLLRIGSVDLLFRGRQRSSGPAPTAAPDERVSACSRSPMMKSPYSNGRATWPEKWEDHQDLASRN